MDKPQSFYTFNIHRNDKDWKVRGPCVICKQAHTACDRGRPCTRCVRLEKESFCCDPPVKKRGRPIMNECSKKMKVSHGEDDDVTGSDSPRSVDSPRGLKKSCCSETMIEETAEKKESPTVRTTSCDSSDNLSRGGSPLSPPNSMMTTSQDKMSTSTPVLHVPELSIVYNGRMKIVGISPELCQILGYSMEDVLGAPWLTLHPDCFRVAVCQEWCNLQTVLEASENPKEVFDWVGPVHGKARCFQSAARDYIYLKGGVITGIKRVFSDVQPINVSDVPPISWTKSTADADQAELDYSFARLTGGLIPPPREAESEGAFFTRFDSPLSNSTSWSSIHSSSSFDASSTSSGTPSGSIDLTNRFSDPTLNKPILLGAPQFQLQQWPQDDRHGNPIHRRTSAPNLSSPHSMNHHFSPVPPLAVTNSPHIVDQAHSQFYFNSAQPYVQYPQAQYLPLSYQALPYGPMQPLDGQSQQQLQQIHQAPRYSQFSNLPHLGLHGRPRSGSVPEYTHHSNPIPFADSLPSVHPPTVPSPRLYTASNPLPQQPIQRTSSDSGNYVHPLVPRLPQHLFLPTQSNHLSARSDTSSCSDTTSSIPVSREHSSTHVGTSLEPQPTDSCLPFDPLNMNATEQYRPLSPDWYHHITDDWSRTGAWPISQDVNDAHAEQRKSEV